MNVNVIVGVGQVASLFFLAALAFIFNSIQQNKIENLEKRILRFLESGSDHNPPVRIVLALPIITRNGVTMPNLEIPVNSTEYVAIQTKDALGNIVPPQAGDTFAAASSDPSITPSVGTMPSGPLAGALAAVLATGATAAQNVTITVTDADGLPQVTQVCDVVVGPPASIFLDVADAVNVPKGP